MANNVFYTLWMDQLFDLLYANISLKNRERKIFTFKLQSSDAIIIHPSNYEKILSCRCHRYFAIKRQQFRLSMLMMMIAIFMATKKRILAKYANGLFVCFDCKSIE